MRIPDRNQFSFHGRPTRFSFGEATSAFASLGKAESALPNTSFIGFTGTPIEKTDANTRATFGDYISIHGTRATFLFTFRSCSTRSAHLTR